MKKSCGRVLRLLFRISLLGCFSLPGLASGQSPPLRATSVPAARSPVPASHFPDPRADSDELLIGPPAPVSLLPEGQTYPEPSPLTVELYFMSRCPYGAKAARSLAEVARRLPGAVELKVDFIARFQGFQFLSLHGPDEVAGDLFQLCARELREASYLDFLSCTMADIAQVPGNWEDCAQKVGLVPQAMAHCAEGGRGRDLLRQSLGRATTAGALGSPTIRIGGRPYRGGLEVEQLLHSICAVLPGPPPRACTSLSPPVAVALTVLTDARCTDCNTDRYVDQLRSHFPGLKVTTVDLGAPEGRTLFREAKLRYLPALIFDESVTRGEGYPHFRRQLMALPRKRWLLPVQVRFDPRLEICDNGRDDTGNGRVDCADRSCRVSPLCRREKRGQLELFVRARSPEGNRALLASDELAERLGSKVRPRIHYLARMSVAEGFTSAGGPAELEETLRQLCIRDLPTRKKAFWKYLRCRAAGDTPDWKTCARENGLDVNELQRCAADNSSRRLLAEDILLARDLQIGESPTWLINNRHLVVGTSNGETVLSEYCRHNPRLAACRRLKKPGRTSVSLERQSETAQGRAPEGLK